MVDGLEKLRARFRALPRAVQEAATQTLEQNANEIVAMMKRLVPKDSGRLAASIGWTWGDAPEGTLAVGTLAKSSDSKLRITIYAGGKTAGGDAFYARFQEFGTENMLASPFFYPSIRANRTKGRARLSRNVRKAAEKAFNG